MPYIGNQPAATNVTSSGIEDGSIVNVDIAANAAIAATKIAGLGTAATTAATAYATAAQGTKADAALPKAGGAVTGAITTNSTFDGVDIATRDAVLTTTTTTANAALPKAGGAVTGNVTFADNGKAIFGAGSDLELYHSGSHSYLDDNGTGNMYVRSNGAGVILESVAGITMARFLNGNACDFNFGSTTRLATTSVGAAVTGELIASSYNETYAAVTSSSNATTVDCHAGNSFSHVLTQNTTFTFSNPPASGTSYTFSIEIIQDSGASGFSVTWPSSVDWPAATAPTLTATASAKDIFVFTTRDGGTNWYGFTAGQALA